MRRIAMALAVFVCAAPIAAGTGSPATVGPLAEVSRELSARLTARGRAEARFVRSFVDPMSGDTMVSRGVMMLEPPDRARLEFAATGEQITLRPDGGEWLQPRLQQMLRFDARDAAGPLRWWRALLGERGAPFRAAARGKRAFVILEDGAAGDSARVWLGADGLPARLDLDEPAGPASYRIQSWRFVSPRGRDAFVLKAPAGFAVIPLQ